jgi:uncharacterized membrane protein YjdF
MKNIILLLALAAIAIFTQVVQAEISKGGWLMEWMSTHIFLTNIMAILTGLTMSALLAILLSGDKPKPSIGHGGSG